MWTDFRPVRPLNSLEPSLLRQRACPLFILVLLGALLLAEDAIQWTRSQPSPSLPTVPYTLVLFSKQCLVFKDGTQESLSEKVSLPSPCPSPPPTTG
jgi:hypothetical protein